MTIREVAAGLVPDDRAGKIGLGTGAVLFTLGVFDSDQQRAQLFKVAGAGVLAFFVLRDRQGSFASSAEIENDAALPAGNAGVSTQEKYNALVGRILGLEPAAGIEDAPERAADESKGPFLGTPKNVLRVAGAWTQPLEGGTVQVAAFADTFQAFAVLENQSRVEVAGQVRARVLHEGLLQSGVQTTMTDGPYLKLAPGEFRELDMRLPVVRDWDGRITLSLYFAGYNLASVNVHRTLVIA